MPWKPTKLKFFGVAVRRRTLFALTYFFAVASVPTISWAVLILQKNVSQTEKAGFVAIAAFTMFATFQGWWLITRQNPLLYRSEARVILLGSTALLLLATALGCQIAHAVIQPARMAYGAPLLLGGAVFLFLIIRFYLLKNLPRRGDIVRGESGPFRKKSKSAKPGETPSPLAENAAEVEDSAEGDEGIDDESSVAEDTTPTQPRA